MMRVVYGVLVLLAAYTVLSEFGWLPDPPFAGLGQIGRFIRGDEFRALLTVHLPATVLVAGTSVSLGVLVGGSVGTLLALGRQRVTWIVSALEVLRAVPAVMWVSLAIATVGLGSRTVFGVTAVVVGFFVASELAYSQHVFQPIRAEHLARLGVGFWQRVRLVHGFEVAEALAVSSKLAVTIGVVVTVLGEMQAGSEAGLGVILVLYQQGQRSEGICCVIFVAAVIGALGARVVDLATAGVLARTRGSHYE
jgi:ABC-type nitrate/sulfonate/bicarbonate transport system permease component